MSDNIDLRRSSVNAAKAERIIRIAQGVSLHVIEWVISSEALKRGTFND